MLTKLPDVFGRNFIIGYFIPSLFFILAFSIFAKEFNLPFSIFKFSISTQGDLLILTTNIGLLSFIIGIILLSLNRELIRFFEGYGKWNPIRLFSRIEKANFERTQKEISKLENTYISCLKQGKEFPANLKQRRNHLLMELANRFPDDESWLLPTSFGNTIRSFEVYSRIMYGIDSIPSWSRILALIPDKYLGFIEDAKAKVDLWVGILALDILLLCGCLTFPWLVDRIDFSKLLLFVLLESIVGVIVYFKAQRAAVEWGNFVKASFDLFLPDLLEKLRLDEPEVSADEEREILRRLSQARIYGNPKSLPRRNKKPKDSSM